MNKNKLSAIIWSAVTLLWFITTIVQIVNNAELWIVIMDAVVLLLSLINVVLNVVNFKNNK